MCFLSEEKSASTSGGKDKFPYLNYLFNHPRLGSLFLKRNKRIVMKLRVAVWCGVMKFYVGFS